MKNWLRNHKITLCILIGFVVLGSTFSVKATLAEERTTRGINEVLEKDTNSRCEDTTEYDSLGTGDIAETNRIKQSKHSRCLHETKCTNEAKRERKGMRHHAANGTHRGKNSTEWQTRTEGKALMKIEVITEVEVRMEPAVMINRVTGIASLINHRVLCS